MKFHNERWSLGTPQTIQIWLCLWTACGTSTRLQIWLHMHIKLELLICERKYAHCTALKYFDKRSVSPLEIHSRHDTLWVSSRRGDQATVFPAMFQRLAQHSYGAVRLKTFPAAHIMCRYKYLWVVSSSWYILVVSPMYCVCHASISYHFWVTIHICQRLSGSPVPARSLHSKLLTLDLLGCCSHCSPISTGWTRHCSLHFSCRSRISPRSPHPLTLPRTCRLQLPQKVWETSHRGKRTIKICVITAFAAIM